MRNNRILGAAVAAALFLPVGSAYGGAENVNDNLTSRSTADTTSVGSVVTCSVASDMGTCAVDSSFDSASGTVVNVPDDGLIYATELFQGAGDPPVVPCGDEPAAVLFTIDGENKQDSTLATFTLTGAKFQDDTDPVLGISDSNGTIITSPTKVGGGEGDIFVEYNIDTDTVEKRLEVGDQLILTYHLKEAST
ncbi:hypothetical protein QUF54_06200, partial [Candidatus Marithioploca araucensis]|nr:hypothetical protein [Candidatus Marithioploca araucensis]